MKVTCSFNNINDIRDQTAVLHLKRYITFPDGVVELEIGKEYVVYGIEFRDNRPWFYICADEHEDYPKPFSSEFFETKDWRLSRCWQLCFEHGYGEHVQSRLVFAEWARDPSYYERLLDEEDQAVAVFRRYREWIDQEQALESY